MPYYLHHYFAPDFNHKHLRPVVLGDGNANAHNLGYVQNVVAGQVLAELIHLPDENADADLVFDKETLDFFDSLPPSGPLARASAQPENAPAKDAEEDGPDEIISGTLELDIPGESRFDPRYIYDTPVFPMGPNCGRDPENPNRIIALASGYCFYNEGLITVKKLLNIRQDVTFATGNVLFVGDIICHGDIYPGFSISGGDILVKGRIDGAFIKAHGSVTCESGIKGAPTASIEAGGTVRLGFCEGTTIKTAGNVVIEGNCLHSTIFAGGSVIIKGRLQGGAIHAGSIVYVKDQVGDAQGGAITRIFLGYNPLTLLGKHEIDQEVKIQSDRKSNYERLSRKGPLFAKECAPLLELADRKLEILGRRGFMLKRELVVDLRQAEKCRVVVPGALHYGAEIRIGKAYFKAVSDYTNVHFRLREDEIDYAYPAISKEAEARLTGQGAVPA